MSGTIKTECVTYQDSRGNSIYKKDIRKGIKVSTLISALIMTIHIL